jgi:hypothetical protein
LKPYLYVGQNPILVSPERLNPGKFRPNVRSWREIRAKGKDIYFLIHFRDPKENKVVGLKARKIEDSSLGLSFVKVSDFVFETSALLAQPTEEQMKRRLEDVKALHLSIYNVISVEEIGAKHSGLKFKKTKSNLIAFPSDQPR